MKKFDVSHRDRSMLVIVSYERVPMARGLAFALRHIQEHGAPIDVFSADRRDHIIAAHNRTFKTNLKGQQYLYDGFVAGRPGFNPANPPSLTSHCRRSDGNAAYRDGSGKVIPRGGLLPWFMLGLDIADAGKVEDVRTFLRVARRLGYRVVQPYPVGGEKHHVIFTESPIGTLERWNQIAKRRRG